MDTEPEGYLVPEPIWLVEYVDPREEGRNVTQVGAFTSETEASNLVRQFQREGFWAQLELNVVPVHHRLDDWNWDR